MSIKNDGHYFCRAGGNRPDGLNEPVTDEQTLLRVDEAINKTYTRRNGAEMSVSRICWDTGGIDPTIVYERSKKHGLFRVIPIKGASVYGKPVASMPRKRNK
ncbi:phage terminase large subunit family protein, partial [Escherichia coli 2860050]